VLALMRGDPKVLRLLWLLLLLLRRELPLHVRRLGRWQQLLLLTGLTLLGKRKKSVLLLLLLLLRLLLLLLLLMRLHRTELTTQLPP